MVFRRFIIALFICCCTGAAAQVQNYRFVNFGSKDGLNDKVVYNATQDRNGYMWFGTATGLYRFDGHRFTYYRSPADRSGSTISNILQAILCDSSGHLWLGSLTTLQWYNPATNTFWEPDRSRPEIQKLCASYFLSFSEGQYTWCSTAKNFVYRFNKSDSSFLSLAAAYPPGASTSSLRTAEYNGYLYDIHSEGIYVFTTDGRFEKFVSHPAADISNGAYDADNKSILLPTYASGLLKFDIATALIQPVAPGITVLKQNNLFSAARDDKGNYLAGAASLFIIDAAKETSIDFYSAKTKNEFSFGAGKVVNIFTDREKNYWFCSFNGLCMMPWQNSQVKTIPLRDEVTGFITEAIGAYEEPGTSNLLLINTSSRGLQRADLQTGTVTTIVNNAEPDLYKKRITGLITAPGNSVYVSDDKHFFKYDVAAKRLQLFPLNDQEGKPIGQVSRSITDNSGRIFIGSPGNGIYIWDYPAGKLFHYNKWDILKDDSSARDNYLLPCIADSKQNIWFTCLSGIYEYRQADGRYYHHTPGPGLPAMGESRYIAEDKTGHIWVATQNNGLYEMYTISGKEVWKNYTMNSGIGLPSDYCNKIKQNPYDSCLWVNNIAGLLKFDPIRKKVISILSMQNGLYDEGLGYTFNLFAGNRLAQLFYGALNIIDLDSYRENKFSPAVQLSSIKVMGKEMLFTPGGMLRVLRLSSSQRFLQFEFAALIFNNYNKNQYAYKLEGADRDWVYSGQVNSVAYSGLKPGTYIFKVKAANNDGVWGAETVYKIIIVPPFYARWWFLALCGAFVVLAVFGWNRFKVNQATKEEKLKAAFQQQIAETEMKALRAQMNPHFIFNSLNSIQKFILKNEHFEASQYLTRFSRLIRLILDHSNQNTVQLSGEIEMLKLYIEMESLRFDNKFSYTVTTGDNLQPDTAEIPSMLIQPYVENAIWHGLLHLENRGSLRLSFEKENETMLAVIVEDNGIGREKAAELKSKQVLKKKSYGMQITEDRIAIINRVQKIHARAEVIDLKDAAGQAAGTRVVLHIPLKTLTA